MALINTDKSYSFLLSFSLVCAFLLPHTMTPLLLVNPILCVILKLKSKNGISFPKKFFPISFVVFALVLGNFIGASSKSMIAAVTIALYLFCFPFIRDVKISNLALYFCLGFIILSQIVYLLNIPYVASLLDVLYPLSDENGNAQMWMRNNITVDTIANYRLGGLYHNSNQCSKYITALIGLFLVNNFEREIKSNIPFFALAYVAVLLTGSRTGFVISTLIIVFYLFKSNFLDGGKRVFFILAMAVFAAYIFFNGSASSLRGFDVAGGFHNSANTKFDTFNYYITHASDPLTLLFGHLDTSLYNPPSDYMSYFDSEYGCYIFAYGVFGFIAILAFYYSVYKRVNKDYRFFFFYLLWMISSTIQCAYRSSFVFMICLSFIMAKSCLGAQSKQ